MCFNSNSPCLVGFLFGSLLDSACLHLIYTYVDSSTYVLHFWIGQSLSQAKMCNPHLRMSTHDPIPYIHGYMMMSGNHMATL